MHMSNRFGHSNVTHCQQWLSICGFIIQLAVPALPWWLGATLPPVKVVKDELVHVPVMQRHLQTINISLINFKKKQ